jgi:protein-disulfide isomerase
MFQLISRQKLLKRAIGLLFLFSSLFEARFALGGEAQEKRKEPGVAARVADEVVTLDEIEKAVASQLAQLDEQRYQLMQSKLEELIAGRLLAREAKRRGIAVEELLKAEVVSKVPEVTEADVTTFITQNKGRLQEETAELRLKVRGYLREQKVAQQRSAYVASLERSAKVERFLEEPEPHRVTVKVEGAFAKGPKDAPVTIVEFSDFQCPFCRTVVATVKEVMRQYPTTVRWAFRDFPIASLHPKAPKVAEAARCAGELGKFWEYHDLLFDHQAQATTEDFKRFADQLKLDPKSFASCLDSGKQQAAVKSDLEEGARLGITGTPTFFINGRMLVGAQPLETFRKVIDSELRRHSK